MLSSCFRFLPCWRFRFSAPLLTRPKPFVCLPCPLVVSFRQARLRIFPLDEPKPQYDNAVAQGDKISQYDKKDEKITTLTTLRNLGDLKGLRQGVDTLAKDNENLAVNIMDTSPKAQYDNAVGVDCHACFARSQ